MSNNPRIQARNARANLTPAGVTAETAAPPKAPEPAAPILAAEAADKPKRARRPKEGPRD